MHNFHKPVVCAVTFHRRDKKEETIYCGVSVTYSVLIILIEYFLHWISLLFLLMAYFCLD